MPTRDELIETLKQAREALEHSSAVMAHYPEAANRHTNAYRAVCAILGRCESVPA